MTEPERLQRPDGESIAYHRLEGKAPGVIFCGGFMSDMTGTKAIALEEHCRTRGQAFVRFDYLGHGQSSGDFAAKGCISRWADDAAAVLTELTDGPQIVVGSSMGGWVALKLALSHQEPVAALVGIAPAPDFTVWMWEDLTSEQQSELTDKGQIRVHSEYDPDGYVITRQLIDDGTPNFVLTDAEIPLDMPVRLLHGMADPDVPWQHSLRIAQHLRSADVRISFSKSGDHRLSEPGDLDLLRATIDELSALISA
ncbi:alpha/beta fold hydrolase [Minwuia sp.]|uniref:alpha/beta fold hydrolase n=1 Tax=Minwuia sp. TaxID=2493630 RepID=UPI003A91B75D